MKHACKGKPCHSWLQTVIATVLFLCWATVGWGQDLSVKGNVTDTKGEPIIGASVVVKGNTTLGTITDMDGQFMLKVPASSTLVISYIGYVTQEIPAKSSLKVVLRRQ